MKQMNRWWLAAAAALFAAGLAAAAVAADDNGQNGKPEKKPAKALEKPVEKAPARAPVKGPAPGAATDEGGGTEAAPSNSVESAYQQIELFTQVLMHVRKYYVQDKSYQQIMAGSLHGMLQSLDPHSDFMEADAFKNMQDDTAGKFGGIGIHLGTRDGLLTVIAPIEDTPAFRAGIQAKDRILAIDGEKVLNLSIGDAVKRLRGDKGTKVTITISRPGEDDTRDVTMVRDDIEVPSVKGAKMVRDGIGYVRITQFAAPTATMLQESLDKLSAQGMKALVLDLRRNPGGLLKSGIEVAEKFLPRNELIVTTKGRKGVGPPVENRAGGDKHYVEMPMVVLIDGGSASAAEIVAGALQDHKRAVLVGETSFGKGSVQSVIQLKPGEGPGIRLTTAYYYTPAGRLIHDKGIEPDIPVHVSVEEWIKVQMRRAQAENPDHFTDEEKKPYLDAVDRQLERAADLLQAVRIFK